LIPSRVGLDLIVEDEGRISFTPKIDGVPPDPMRQAFFALDDVDAVYAVDSSEGDRVRVVLDETQREVLRRMQRVRHLKGPDQAEVLRDPHTIFDGIAEAININQEVFGPRVKGIGDFPFVVQPYLQRSTTGFFEDPEEIAGRREKGSSLACGLPSPNTGSETYHVTAQGRSNLDNFPSKTRRSLAPDYRRFRSLRLRADGLQRLAPAPSSR